MNECEYGKSGTQTQIIVERMPSSVFGGWLVTGLWTNICMYICMSECM